MTQQPDNGDGIVDVWELVKALSWVDQVYPAKNKSGGATVDMTWDEWNRLRRALGLRDQRPGR